MILDTGIKMRDFRQLKVWEEAHELTLEIYQVTKNYPKDELFGLTSQMRRSGSSIPTNIAEGCGRETNKDYAHFLQIALGSAFELDYQILLSKDLSYIDQQTFAGLNNRVDKVRRQLANLIRKVRASA
ncbi:MAG: four helix bundle protein [Pyrinomonadaceae bacterium]